MNTQSDKIMEWNGQKLKYGIAKKVIDILGKYIVTVSTDMLDGMGTFEAQELREERAQLFRMGAIKL